MLTWVVRLVASPVALLAWLSRSGWRRRSRKHLLAGLPALIVAGALAALALVAHSKNDDWVDAYRDAALAAFRNNDLQAAKIYFERLSELDGDSQSTQFDLGLTLDMLGQDERAEAIMVRLAPLDKAGFPQAHRWLAQRLLARRRSFVSPQLLRVAHQHLLRAEQGLPDSPEIQFQFSQYYVAIGQPDLAIQHLRRAVARMPELSYELALLYASTGNVDTAIEATHQADELYRQRVAIRPSDDDARLRWASTRMNLGDFAGVIQILSDGLAIRRDGPYQKALAAAYVAQCDRLERAGKPNAGTRLLLLRTALGHVPDFEPGLVRLVNFAGSTPEDFAQARELLESLIARGDIPAVAHFALGAKAWHDHDVEKARWHLERAYKLDSELAPIANNLAWLLAYLDPPDLERALRIIDPVVERWSDNAEYRETRGQILTKLQRWQDALDDLQLALPALRRRKQLHQSLAVVYSKLDIPELAQRHTSIAEQLPEEP